MFNPNTKVNAKDIWSLLGTFYQYFDSDSKSVIEAYWTSLLNGVEGMYYNLAQYALSDNLVKSQGFIEFGYQVYDIDPEMFTISGLYKLPMTSLYHLTIPTLEGKYTGNTLVENIDYTVSGGHYIRFNNNPIKDSYLSRQGICALPILTNFYIPSFGEETDPEIILRNRYYTPYVSGYNGLTYFEKQKAYAKHITRWAGAITNKIIKGPTMRNLKDSLALFHNVPFAEEPGIITSIIDVPFTTLRHITVSGAKVITYEIPNDLSMIVSVGDTVNYFDLFCEGTYFWDNITNPAIISGMTDWTNRPLDYYCTLAYYVTSSVKNLNYYPNFTLAVEDIQNSYFKTNILPQHLLISGYQGV
jgi:hypothetical protein